MGDFCFVLHRGMLGRHAAGAPQEADAPRDVPKEPHTAMQVEEAELARLLAPQGLVLRDIPVRHRWLQRLHGSLDAFAVTVWLQR